MITLSSSNFKNEVNDFKGIVVVDFWAPWCGPCRIVSPMLEKLEKEYDGKKVKFAKLNVDENQGLAALFGIMGIPTVIFFKDGRIVNQRVGVMSEEAYKTVIDQILNEKPSVSKGGKQEVIVFSAPSCPWCRKTKEYLKSRGIKFKDIDVSKDQHMAQEMVRRSGEMGVPQLWINGQVVVGFNRPRIDMLLGLS